MRGGVDGKCGGPGHFAKIYRSGVRWLECATAVGALVPAIDSSRLVRPDRLGLHPLLRLSTCTARYLLSSKVAGLKSIQPTIHTLGPLKRPRGLEKDRLQSLFVKRYASTMGCSHIEECRQVIHELRRVLELPHSTEGTYLSRFLFLTAVLQSQNSGTKGAGLTGGVQQENLWFEMLSDGSTQFVRKPPQGVRPTKDHDYYFNTYPLSHKTIGYRGSGSLALAWSKNPPGGTQRNEFESSMVIVCTRKPNLRGRWSTIGNGIYIIPLPILKEGVVFQSNNKSDSIISADHVVTCMLTAATHGLRIPFKFDPTVGRYRVMSLWHAGSDAIREIRP